MIRKIKKQGGSLIMSIPKEIAENLALHENQEMDITLKDTTIIIKPAPVKTQIKGYIEAAKEYKEANAGGRFDPRYGRLMFDKSDGKVWTDLFYNLGHNDFKVYHSDSIINLGDIILCDGKDVTANTVKEYAEKLVNTVDWKG